MLIRSTNKQDYFKRFYYNLLHNLYASGTIILDQENNRRTDSNICLEKIMSTNKSSSFRQ